MEYVRPIHFSAEPLRVQLTVAELRAFRFVIAATLHQDGVLAARARTTLCPVVDGRPRRITGAERRTLERAALPSQPLRPVAVGPVGRDAHVHPVVVRWGDLDRFGHVNNVRFFDYVQEARIAMTTSLTPAMTRLAAGPEAPYRWLVVRQDVDYHRQLTYRREPYAVRTDVAAIGASSITFAVDIVDPLDAATDRHGRRGGRCGGRYADARTVLVCADGDGRPTQVPDDIRASLRPGRPAAKLV